MRRVRFAVAVAVVSALFLWAAAPVFSRQDMDFLKDRNKNVSIDLRDSDVLDVLENTAWVNKYNDAETRNLREVFELRLFNSFVTNVSGRGIPTLANSQYRTNQLTEFEHNLWQY